MKTMKACTWLLLLLTMVFLATVSAAAQPATTAPAATAAATTGVVPQELDSPRATMTTFLEGMHDVRDGKNGAWERVLSCLDLSRLPAGPDAENGQSIAQQLYGIINRIETVDVDTLPDRQLVDSAGANQYLFFPQLDNSEHQKILAKVAGKLPGRIGLRRQSDGRWLFSAATIAAVPDLYNAMAALPEVYTGESAPVISTLGPTFYKTRWWGWVLLLAAIFVGLALGKLLQSVFRKLGTYLKGRDVHVRGTMAHSAANPASLLLFALALQVGLGGLFMLAPLREFSGRVIVFLYIVAVGWFFYNLVEVIDLWLRRLTARTESKLDDMVVPLVRKTLRIFLIIVFTLVVAQNVFGLNITAWLAGLSIAGLAISFAAQESIKNLFGSITVFFDRPFTVGDFVSFEGHDAVVEEIGFRSTKMRTLDGHLVTVPNMKFIDNSVRNITARPHIRRVLDVTIPYDTPAEKIEQAIQILRDLLAEPQIAQAFDLQKLPPRVAFNDYNAASLNIKVFYWYQIGSGRDYWSYLAHCELFNLKLFRAFGRAGIEFAFPTQTLFLASDPARKLTVHAGAPSREEGVDK